MPVPWIRRHDHFEELPSTSTHLAEIWRSGVLTSCQTPIVITADRQTAGRGRGDHRWFSDDGSLTFTLGLRPEEFQLSLANLVPIGLLTACAMIESIEQLWPDVAGLLGVRWPNDIECDSGKVGGVLPECIVQDDRGMLVLIGVGINISTNLSQGPMEARLIGTALADLGQIAIEKCSEPKMELLKTFLACFPAHLGNLGEKLNPWILEARKYDRLAGQIIEAKQGHEHLKGRALGWDASGRLELMTNAGNLVKISSGQIFRNMPPNYL